MFNQSKYHNHPYLNISQQKTQCLNYFNVVYKIDCSDCETAYIGKTIRQIYRRFQEHKASKIKAKEINSQPKSLTESSSDLRRSDKNKGKVTEYCQKIYMGLSIPK